MSHNIRENLERAGHVLYPSDATYTSTVNLGTADNSFNDSVCRLVNAPIGARVSSTVSGGGQYQIGDYTWETEPENIVIEVIWFTENPDNDSKPVYHSETREYRSLPELWEVLA